MKRVLVVESDEEQSQKLSEAIEARGAFSAIRAATVREACLLIAQEPFDLAFIPGADVVSARQALHAMQPELELAAIVRGEALDVPALDVEDLRGVVFTDAPEEGLRDILGDTATETVLPDDHTMIDTGPELSVADTQVTALATVEETIVSEPLPAVETEEDDDDRLRRALEAIVADEQIVGGVVLSSGEIIASAGSLTAEQTTAIVRRIGLTWRDESTALLQFIRPPDRTSDLLLFTRPLRRSQLLTLAVKPDYHVGKLRRVADELARELVGADVQQRAEREERAVAAEQRLPDETGQRSFALIFQPRRPMPAAMRAAVSTALYDVAEEAGLNLHFQQVDGELVHLVTTCPPQRGSGWLARLYKAGVEERIQNQFGVSAQMWRRGFYAIESELPLSDAELKLFAGDELE
ncbi:MAG: hypothetical protein ACOC9Z_05955 [Chloroflexota bacterium]